MSGIMEAFRGMFGPAGNTPVGTQTNINANPTIPNANTPRSDGSVGAIPPAPTNKEQSPLANYADLWKVDTKAGDNLPPSLIPKLNLDPAKLNTQIASMDFVKSVPQELLAKAMTGTDPQAMITIMNSIAQEAFKTGLTTNARLVEESFTAHSDALTKHHLPASIRDATIRQEPVSDVMNNPAFAPLVDTLRSQVSRQYPTATAQEVAAHTKTIFEGMSQEVLKAYGYEVKAPAQTINNGRPANIKASEDWDNWVTTSPAA